jgi:hypothetical protein
VVFIIIIGVVKVITARATVSQQKPMVRNHHDSHYPFGTEGSQMCREAAGQKSLKKRPSD